MNISKFSAMLVAAALGLMVGFIHTLMKADGSGLDGLGRVIEVRVSSFAADQRGSGLIAYRPSTSALKETVDRKESEEAGSVFREAKRREIMGEPHESRRVRRFLELVILPFGVCFLLVALLRKGFWE